MKNLCCMVALTVFLIACPDFDKRARDSVSDIVYTQDKITGLCFAVIYSGYGNSISNVPCTNEVLAEIRRTK